MSDEFEPNPIHDAELSDLLRHADSGATPAPLPQQPARLVGSVLRRRRRRRVIRSVSAATVLLLVGLGILPWLRAPDMAPLVAADPLPEVEPSRNDAADDHLIALHTRTAELLLAAEQRQARARASETPQPDVLQIIARHRDDAAMSLLRHAAAATRDSEHSGTAADLYRTTVRLFPDTPAATVAARRLEQM